MLINRDHHQQAIQSLLQRSPVVALLGARQVGKTTLAQQVEQNWESEVSFFDLESQEDVVRLDDPLTTLKPLKGLVILDEVQRVPEIFPTLRVLSDRSSLPARFLVLGGATPNLLKQSSESLAGRIAYYEISGFSPTEVSPTEFDKLWLRGGFPRSFTARNIEESIQWRKDFIRTFTEREIAQFGINVPGNVLSRFWFMLAHYHAQVINVSELGRALEITYPTVQRYIYALESTFMVRTLKPWFAQIKKRQVKAQKIYIRDSGIFHCLADILTREQLDRNPKIGASWEGYIIESLIQILKLDEWQCHYWRTHLGAEIDLVVKFGERLRGFEIKRTTSPRVTPSMRNALADLKLDRIDVIHAGSETYPLSEKIVAISSSRLMDVFANF